MSKKKKLKRKYVYVCVRNRCNCHPETCNCNSHVVYLVEDETYFEPKRVASGMNGKLLEKMVKLANKGLKK